MPKFFVSLSGRPAMVGSPAPTPQRLPGISIFFLYSVAQLLYRGRRGRTIYSRTQHKEMSRPAEAAEAFDFDPTRRTATIEVARTTPHGTATHLPQIGGLSSDTDDGGAVDDNANGDREASALRHSAGTCCNLRCLHVYSAFLHGGKSSNFVGCVFLTRWPRCKCCSLTN